MRVFQLSRLSGALFAGAAAGLFAVCPGRASVVVETNLSVAPLPVDINGNLNPTWNTWNANAISAIGSGSATAGDTSGPSGYIATPTIRPGDYFSTAGDASAAPLPGASPYFPSWRAVANPPGSFATEHGSALFFPFRILGNGQKIAIGNVTNVMSSNDPSNFWGFGTGLISSNGTNYTPWRVGVIYGPSGKAGPGETLINNGQPGSTPVDEIDDSGVAVWQQISSSYGGSPQNQIDQSISAFYDQFPMTQVTNTYTLTDGNGAILGQATATADVPEPSSLVALALCGLLLIRRRRAIPRLGAE